MTVPNPRIAIAVERSGNSKIGKASATSVAQVSCPTSCPLYHAGCYAESGFQGMVVTSKLNAAATKSTPLDAAKAEAMAISTLSGKRPLRLHVVGDCATNRAAQLVSTAAEAHTQKHQQPVWSYTHAWRDVKRSSWAGVSILASCENPDDLKQARAKGYATAVVVESFPTFRRYALGNGEEIIPCPQMTGKAASCTDCRLCFNDRYLRDAKLSIAFEVHGQGKKKVLEQLIQITKGNN